jgi:hypothetical protein
VSTEAAAGTLGQISAIMLGINAGAMAALKLGPATSVDSQQEAAFYRSVLQGIVEHSERAENIYQKWMAE